MPRYHITLPPAIPDELFDNLGGTVHDGIKARLRYRYTGIDKDTYNDAATSLEALSNVVARRRADIDISAKSLIKMFRPVVGDYVREAPRLVVVQPVQPQAPERPAQEQLELFR